ncbi:cobalt-precorrin-6A reductase [Octadecabacter sp.]|nr:cobalt-precorrin-6A reductase [Octadecabacter sp.]
MTLLLLAGTAEARRIAWGLVDSGVRVTASLAGATRHPEPMPVPTRIGGFGGEDGFRAYLSSDEVTAVLDATHPFATRISTRTARICDDMGVPYVQVVRPAWSAQAGDNWTDVDAPDEAAAQLPVGAVVFLATGRQTMAEYGPLEGRRVLVRVIDPSTAPLPFEQGEFVIGRPPFSVRYEEDLFAALGVTHLVVKNAGGEGGRAKLDAARNLGLPVIMVRRPAAAHRAVLNSVEEALTWAATL